ncbi:hypothetical protein CHLNCDRAFT_136076 [Chlorella variabilis]|uniref:Uncharacterized protein n=1 Tax=Chlorella variabilis TaxID=554065 RepID=E1ZJP7_CHLVA|nr:hypothetical protein CHLNCDRAFT_136076 [Chlorella variabilis]EFN53901.1 hypothetical protein CHLNCDRAFT_136076 [Chlorella variabilis]|eukprot:XP_005846003.1 hypothetical protein CHLNCDRAFT_136076 [Chlorella variabilis]
MAEVEVALPHGPPPPSPYRSAAGRAALHAHYNKALAALPYQHEEKLVETSFGTAHVLVCGPADAPPLVLWHGMAVPGPFMIRTLDPLVQHYRVYAPDHPFQAGSRTQDAELDINKHENGKWSLEVLRGLGLVPPAGAEGGKAPPPPLHVGVSFGGAVLLDLAVVAPEAIRGAALVVPGGLMPAAGWMLLFRLILPARLYHLLPCSFTAWLALVSMCDEPFDAAHQQILLNWRHVVRYQQLPGGDGGFSREQLSRLAAPTIVITAEHDIFWAGQAAAEVAAAALPDCKTFVIPGAKHLPSKEKQAELSNWILEFFASRGLAGFAT